MKRSLTVLDAVFRRELATVARTPGYGVLSVGLLVVLGGLVAVGGGGETGFVPAVVDLLLPTEVLVPLVAVVLGYRALLTDAASGELAVLRTYRVRAWEYVLGTLAARVVGFFAVVLVPYALVGGYVWLTASPETAIFATHTGVDSPWLYVRFLAFVALLGVAYLALAAAVSTLATSRRSAVALGGVVLAAGVLGGDLWVVRALADGAAVSRVPELLAATPNGAFRGLVFEYVVGVAFAPDGSFVDTGRAVGSLVGWTVLGAGLATLVVGYGRGAALLAERARHRLDG